MPLISNFYGILIRMYFNDDEKHHLPHFHAEYGGESASFDFEGNLLAGTFPPSKTKLVSAWAEIHQHPAPRDGVCWFCKEWIVCGFNTLELSTKSEFSFSVSFLLFCFIYIRPKGRGVKPACE